MAGADEHREQGDRAMRVLVACEESQAVAIAFRRLGHEAYSCDIQDCSGDRPQWHIKDDVLKVLNYGWDMLIGFPPCIHLAISGAKHFKQKQKDGRQQRAIKFFLDLWDAPIKHICLENPIGIMSRHLRKPDQIIQPWQFGHKAQKSTCLWLKNLPLLKATNITDKGEFHITKSGKKIPKWYNLPPSINRSKLRSKTFFGIAAAMANQWSSPIYEEQLKLFKRRQSNET